MLKKITKLVRGSEQAATPRIATEPEPEPEPEPEVPPFPILNLPVEIQTLVLASADSLQTTLSLAATCKDLRGIWSQNKTAIVDHVLRNTVPCFADALELAKAQEFAMQFAGRETTAAWERLKGFYGDLAPMHVRMMKNTKIAHDTMSHFLHKVIRDDMSHDVLALRANNRRARIPVEPHRQPVYLTATEQARFLHALYRTLTYKWYGYEGTFEGLKKQKMILGITAEERPSDDVAAAQALEEQWRLCEIAYMLLNPTDPAIREDVFLGLYYQHCTDEWKAGLGQIFETYRKTLMSLGHDGIIPDHEGCPKQFYMAVFDVHQDRLAKMCLDIVQGRRKDY